MIKFKDLTTADKDIIQGFTLWGDRMNCDLSFANLISWRFLYNTQFAIVEDYLVFRFYAGHHLAYMMPLAKPREQADGTFKVEPCDECSVRVIRAIRDDSIAMGHPFLLLGVCNYMTSIIEEAFPDTFQIKPDRDYADYVYTRDKLINLSGKKLQSKRNHINKFKNLYPNYEYRDLTPELIPECLRLECQWRKAQDDSNQDESRTEELRSMTRAFDRWERLGLLGGTIWVEGKLIAFTFGCPINQKTFDVCVEKADTSYEGSFTIINQEFIKHLPEQYYYINREEDMGEEGLRNAKLSYKPDILLEKNVIMEKHPLADFEDQDRILKETRELWKQSFGDSETFMDLYFSRVYKNEYNITCQINHHVVAALQTLPYTLLYHGEEIKTAYLSGVCVSLDFRRQDIGNNLMRQAHFSLYYKGITFATLIPAEPWLYEWYGKCGYANCITCTQPPFNVKEMSFLDFDKWQREQDCILMHDEEGLDIIKEDIHISEESYEMAVEPIQAMLRVINAKNALEAYAKRNPSADCTIRVQGDHDIPMNNAYYIIKDGTVCQTDEPDTEAIKMNIRQLSEFIFKEEKATMNLMLN
jgi:uncharacterized protein